MYILVCCCFLPAPSASLGPEVIRARPGDVLALECSVTGGVVDGGGGGTPSSSSFAWRHNGSPVSASTRPGRVSIESERTPGVAR